MSAPPETIDAIMGVMEAAFDPAYGEAWNRKQIGDALTLPNTHALIIDEDGNSIEESAGASVGFVLSRHAADEEELLLIAVTPDQRGRGFGQLLLSRLFENARSRGAISVFLEMRRGNPAEYLYRKVGFEPIGERPNYYRMVNGSRIDAITFGRKI